MGEKIRIIIADDSAIIRGLLEKLFKAEDDFEVLESVSNGRKLVDSARARQPDLVISDVDMPEMNGIEAARMIHNDLHIPVAIFSEDEDSQTPAMQAGALLFEKKPALSAFKMENLKPFVEHLRASFKSIRPQSFLQTGKRGEPVFSEFKIVCLGASTGGPTAVQSVLQGLGKDFPLPILYAQHIDVGADKKMAEWFDASCPNIKFMLAEDGMETKRGCVYMAPAEKHLVIDYVKPTGEAVIKLSDEPPEHFLRPAVNKLFRSGAQHFKSSCLGVLLTGMGRDGAEGCKMILDNEGYTIVEDKSTCTVFGMPAAAIELGGAKEVLPRDKIAARLLELVKPH